VTPSSLSYPVICLDQNGIPSVSKNALALDSCSVQALKNGYFSGLLVIEPNGSAWEVLSVEKVGGVGPLGGWRLPFFSRQVRVVLSLGRRQTLGVGTIKELLCKALDRHPDFWEEEEDLGELKQKVRNAVGFGDLVQIFE
jgi:hypothetical protein